MTTQALTLTDFLLARIAEDEAVAEAAREHEYLSPARDASPLRWVRDTQGYGTIFANSGRVLAECEAKRRIVAAMKVADEDGSGAYELGFGLSVAMLHLAAVYADHPDYRDEWAV